MQQAQMAAEEGEELQPHHLPPDVAATVQWTTGPPGDPGLAEDAVEDAFIALGRLMKNAGKGLWRRVSLKDKDKDKDKNKDGGESGGENDDTKGKRKRARKDSHGECRDQDSQVSEKQSTLESDTLSNTYANANLNINTNINTNSPPANEAVPRPRKPLFDLSESLPAQSPQEEGRVWEEEISEDFRKRLSGFIEVPESLEPVESDPKDKQATLDARPSELTVVTSTVEATGGKPRSPR